MNFSKKQLQAIKNVETAMKEASKLKLDFWDNYGTLTCFDKSKMSLPVPLPNSSYIKKYSVVPVTNDMVYELKTNNFYAGNADDPLYTKLK